MAYQLQDPQYRMGVAAAAVWYALGLVYFAVIGRHRLVLSPEEVFALRHGVARPPGPTRDPSDSL